MYEVLKHAPAIKIEHPIYSLAAALAAKPNAAITPIANMSPHHSILPIETTQSPTPLILDDTVRVTSLLLLTRLHVPAHAMLIESGRSLFQIKVSSMPVCVQHPTASQTTGFVPAERRAWH